MGSMDVPVSSQECISLLFPTFLLFSGFSGYGGGTLFLQRPCPSRGPISNPTCTTEYTIGPPQPYHTSPPLTPSHHDPETSRNPASPISPSFRPRSHDGFIRGLWAVLVSCVFHGFTVPFSMRSCLSITSILFSPTLLDFITRVRSAMEWESAEAADAGALAWLTLAPYPCSIHLFGCPHRDPNNRSKHSSTFQWHVLLPLILVYPSSANQFIVHRCRAFHFSFSFP
jgi:hypothetical protein